MREAQLYALERPLTIELVERLIRWLVPLKERAAAVGIGRRQVLVIAAFLWLMTAYAAFHEYWSVQGDQDEFFEGQREGSSRSRSSTRSRRRSRSTSRCSTCRTRSPSRRPT